MSAFISILVYFVIFFFVIKKVRQVKAGQGTQGKNFNTITGTTPAQPVNRPLSDPGPVPVNRAGKANGVNPHMAREKINIKGWEDRKGDWLARQMAEEKLLERKLSDMFQMKMEHRHNCEAEMLRRFHEDACDAEAVDSAEVQ